MLTDAVVGVLVLLVGFVFTLAETVFSSMVGLFVTLPSCSAGLVHVPSEALIGVGFIDAVFPVTDAVNAMTIVIGVWLGVVGFRAVISVLTWAHILGGS